MGVRYTQPQTPVQIDWGNPLTRGLCLGNTASLFTNAVNGALPTRRTISVTNKAEAVYFHANGEVVFSAPGIRAFVGRYLFDSTNGRFGGMFSSTNRSGIYFEYSSSQLKVVVFNNGIWLVTNIGSTPATDALITLAVVSDSDTSHRVYRDGVLVATLTNTAQVSTFNVAGAMYCDASTFYTAAVKGVVGFAGFTSTPSNTEIKAISDNPWQIFKSQSRRIWVGAAGGLTLIPSLYTDPDAFYSPTVSPGAVTLSPSLFTDSDTFYSPTVTPGSITLSPNLLVDADTFYSATVTPGGVNLAPALLSSTNTFYSPTVSTGSVNISPSLFVDADTFYSPAVSLDGSPQTLTPGLFVDSDTFYSATVAAGGVTLNPSLFVDADTFYIPTVSLDGAPQNLTPSLYVDSDTFYSPVVSSSGSQNLSPSLFVDADIFYSFSIINGGFAKRGEYENDQSARRTHIQESKRSNIQTSRRR